MITSSLRRSAGVAFDIDGVLLRGKQPVASAAAALRALQRASVPFVLLTNGGGYPEATKAAALSQLLDVEIAAEQVILSHTPMRELAADYGDRLVLVVGKRYDQLRAIAAAYGFKRVITIEELHGQHPTLYGDVEVDPALSARVEAWHAPIHAVLALTDPVLWGRELQLTCDVLRSCTGQPGSDDGGDGSQVPLYSACADFEYTAEPPVPRFGSGAFHFALDALYRASVGRELETVRFGKPEATCVKLYFLIYLIL